MTFRESPEIGVGGHDGLLVDEEDLRVCCAGGRAGCGCEAEGDDAVGAVADDWGGSCHFG